MKPSILKLFCLFLLLGFAIQNQVAAKKSESVYTQKFNDSEAFYFTPENFGFRPDAKSDISDLLQKAINKLKLEQNLGIIFIPEGTYFLSKTIYIPAAIRLIGYGKKRPLIVLRKNSPGYQAADSSDKGKARYMFWFTSSIAEPDRPGREDFPSRAADEARDRAMVVVGRAGRAFVVERKAIPGHVVEPDLVGFGPTGEE